MNQLQKLEPTLFSAAQEVSREPFGAVDAINTAFDDRGVAIGDEVTVPIAPTRAAEDFVPAAAAATGTAAEADDVKVRITKSRKVPFHLTGEQLRSLDNGATSAEWIRQMLAQGMRTLRNEAERDLVNEIKVGASRAAGAAGTSPFADDLNALVDVRKILRDNGAPMSDMQFVYDTSAEAALLKLGVVQKADQSGSPQERRTGILLPQFGFSMRASAGIEAHEAGTGADYVTDGATAQGVRTVGAKTGTGTILPGDVVTMGGVKYVVNEALANGTFRIGRPGARNIIADESAIALSADYTPLLAFERGAVAGVMRPPVIPQNPTISQVAISDEFGMTYLLLDIAQYGQRTWELHLAWGFRVVQGEHVAILQA